MGAAELRARLRQQPFVPLRLHLTDGKSFDIRHPEMALLARSTMMVGFEREPGTGIADAFEFVALLHIVRVEFLDGKAAPASAN